MPVRDNMNNTADPEIQAVFQVFSEELEHENCALIELNQNIETTVIEVYHDSDGYPVDRYVSIISHITQIMERDDYPEYHSSRVAGVNPQEFPEGTPEGADTYDKYHIKL